MKDQKERYRKAKEELKRVQEDFRSLRERLKVRESFISLCVLLATCSNAVRKVHSFSAVGAHLVLHSENNIIISTCRSSLE